MREFINLVENETLLTKQIVLKDGTPATLTANKIGHGISVNVETADDYCGGTTFGENSWAGMPGTWSATTSHVNTEWRRKGVATAVYNAMEEMGHKVVPEPRAHKRSADADAFWSNRRLKESVSPQSVIDVANYFLDTRDDLLDDDEDADVLVDGDEAFAEEIIRREYVSGTCGAYAVALHDKTGYPIVFLNGGMHVAVRAPDGDIIDYLGKNPLGKVLKRYGMGKNTPIKEWTREETVKYILMDAEEGDPWDEISIAKWVLAHRSQLSENTDYRSTYEWKKAMRGDVEVMIDVAKVDASFSKDRNFYVGPQGAGGITGRYERFDNWIKGGSPVEMPEVCLTDQGEISFINGRHRFAWMRDHGVKVIPVAVPAEYAEAVKAKFGAATKEKFGA